MARRSTTKPEVNYLGNKALAERQAERIRTKWRALGYEVKVEVIPGEFTPAWRCTPYFIRSDLTLSGRPPESARISEGKTQ